MPIYEYQCAACTKVTEMLQKFSDPAPSKCELCGGGPLQKLISQTSFVLNGTGWYVTDFKNGKQPTPKTPDAPKAPEAAAPSAAVPSASPAPQTPSSPSGGSEPTK